MIGLVLAYVSGMRSLRDVIGGTLQTVAIQAAERVTKLVQNEVQRVRLLGSAPLRVRQPVEAANQSYPMNPDKVQVLINARMHIWEKGLESAPRLLNSELSRFLLETKVRDGDKVVGLLITDQYGALLAAGSEPVHFHFWERALVENGPSRWY